MKPTSLRSVTRDPGPRDSIAVYSCITLAPPSGDPDPSFKPPAAHINTVTGTENPSPPSTVHCLKSPPPLYSPAAPPSASFPLLRVPGRRTLPPPPFFTICVVFGDSPPSPLCPFAPLSLSPHPLPPSLYRQCRQRTPHFPTVPAGLTAVPAFVGTIASKAKYCSGISRSRLTTGPAKKLSEQMTG